MSNLNVNSKFNLYKTTSQSETVENKIEEDTAISFIDSEDNEELLQAAIETFSGFLFGDGIFTNAEAEAYVTGENEIAELLKEAKGDRSFVETILDPNKYEREIRAEYEKEHPEYARVAKDGKKLQEEYDYARAATEKIWLETNPEPENKYQKGNGLFGFSQTEEYKQWHKEKEQALADFDKDYRYNNPDYDNLACAQAKNKSLIEIALGAL